MSAYFGSPHNRAVYIIGHSGQLGRDHISSAKARKPASQPQRETAALCPSLEHITLTN